MSAKWDSRFMDLARLVSTWSKDPSTKVGCVIADEGNRIISTGYNGPPRGVRDDNYLGDRDTKLGVTLHAEHNAILWADRSLVGTTLYVYPFPPCAHCAAQIVQVGIARVVFHPRHVERWADSFELAANLLHDAGVTATVLQGVNPQ